MRSAELLRALVAVLPTQRPIFLWGPPGIGKSACVRQAAKELQWEVIDLRATLLDPVDLRGLPTLKKDKAWWCPPAFLPTEGQGLLFLDELAQAAPSVQAACLQLTLERQLGEYILPAGWTVIAASNRPEDRSGTHRLLAPLLNRFIHLELDVHHEDWQAWATSQHLHSAVCAFLRFRPKLLYQFEPQSSQRAFATPRSWQFVSDILPQTPSELLYPLVTGCVGEGPAAEFVGFLQLYRDLPDLDKVLTEPLTATIPHEPAVLYALLGALTELCRQQKQRCGQLALYATRLPAEFAVVALRDCLSIEPQLVALPQVQLWLTQARQQGLFPALTTMAT